MNPNPGLSMVSEHSHPLDGAFPDSTSNSNDLYERMMALMVKWRAEDKERSMKLEAEAQERQRRYQSTSPLMKSDLDPVDKTPRPLDSSVEVVRTSTEDHDLVEETHKPSGYFVEQMVCDSPDKALDGDRVNRKLREELRWDSLKLSIKFSKLLHGKSQDHKAFIPKRFEDLKPKGGIKCRRILIKLNYHTSRFKKSKSPRRTLDLDRTGRAISQRCVRVKTVRMKKQDHRGKRTTQVKLAQACKSLGMFLGSPSFRNPKDYMQICLDKKQISDTGRKRETHHFVYGFTFLALMEIDGLVDTWIGDQSIFAEEEIKALEPDDLDAAVEFWQDETSMVPDLEETANYKSRAETSHVQQQKWKRGFHKVRFKDKRHLRKPLCTGRVVLQKKVSVWSHHKTRKKEMIGMNIPVKPLRQLEHKDSNGKVASGRLMEPGYGKEEKRSSIVSHSNHVWKPGRISKKPPEPKWSLVDASLMEIIELHMRHAFICFRFSRSLKKWIRETGDTVSGTSYHELYVWDPGEISIEKIQEFIFSIKCCLLEMGQNMRKCSGNSVLELFTRKVYHMKAGGEEMSGATTHNGDILLSCSYAGLRTGLYTLIVLSPYQKTKVWNPGQAMLFQGISQTQLFLTGAMKERCFSVRHYDLNSRGRVMEIKVLSTRVLKMACVMVAHKSTQTVVISYAWGSVLAYDVALSDGGKTGDGSYQQQGLKLIENCSTDAHKVTASIVHQLEDKLVLHRGSIDNSKYFWVKDLRMETRCFSAYVELDMIDGELRPVGVVWLPGTLPLLSDYMMEIVITVHAAVYHTLEIMKLISTTCEAGSMVLINSEDESDGDTTSGWKRYMRYSRDTDIYDKDMGDILSLALLMMHVFYSQVKGDEVVVSALRQTLHCTQESFQLPRPPELYTKGGKWCSVTTSLYSMFNLEDKVVVNRGVLISSEGLWAFEDWLLGLGRPSHIIFLITVMPLSLTSLYLWFVAL